MEFNLKCKELSYEERRQPFANLKDLQNVIRDKMA